MKFILTDKEIKGMEQRMFTEATIRLLEDFRESEEAKRVTFDKEKAKREALMAARAECDVYFNFNDPNITVFSVERIDHNTEIERTIIGYYVSEALEDKSSGDVAEPMVSVNASVGPSGPYATGTTSKLVLDGATKSENISLKKIKQWYVSCSREQHNKLVAQFEESRGVCRGQENTTKKQLLQG